MLHRFSVKGSIWAIAAACIMVIAATAIASAHKPAASQHGRSLSKVSVPAFRDCADVCPEMIAIQPGSFVMGSSESEDGHYKDESPQHTVTISYTFAVGKYPVTFAQWDACVKAGGCNGYRPGDGGFGRGTRPVVNVSWDDTQAYVQWLSRKTGHTYRLLTEAEYEYATRAGTKTVYWWGNNYGKGHANCDLCGTRWDARKTSPVGSFAPNAFGLYDMVGNTWEWIDDCVHDDYTGAPADGSAWTSGDCTSRMRRGGDWDSTPSAMRSASRSYAKSSERGTTNSGEDCDFGFRVARTD